MLARVPALEPCVIISCLAQCLESCLSNGSGPTKLPFQAKSIQRWAEGCSTASLNPTIYPASSALLSHTDLFWQFSLPYTQNYQLSMSINELNGDSEAVFSPLCGSTLSLCYRGRSLKRHFPSFSLLKTFLTLFLLSKNPFKSISKPQSLPPDL